MTADEPLSFRLLGPVTALDGTGAPLVLGGPRRRAVLAALLLERGRSLPVERLVELLWPAPAPSSAATMVHGAVAALRRALESRGGPRVLVTRDGGYAVEVLAEQLDIARFETALAEGRRDLAPAPGKAARLLAQALAEWRGPALAGVEETFARAAAQRLDELRVEARALRVDAELRLGHHGAIVAELETLAAEHPLREDVCALLMLALYRCGRQAEALAAYRRLRTVLAGELGVEPEKRLSDLHLAVLRHDPALHPGPAGTAVLPAPLGSFVGRGGDVDRIGALLRAHRLVTLTGPGGVGKTRLAVEIARREADAEAVIVDLAPLADPALLQGLVAEALGVRAEPGQPLARTVAAALAVRPALLVLDNCEHLVAESATLVQLLLAAAAPLRVLATSREPLGVPGERVYSVHPLSIPSEGESAEQAAASAAVRLFGDRAAATGSGFTVTAANVALIGELCRRLDGLPLAIELAAARAATLPLAKLVDRLNDPFALLESVTRAADPRHRSLAATLAWGHGLLGDTERSLFARLAVFPGRFDLAAANAVSGGPAEVELPLARLVASSLVQPEEQSDGGMRYRLLETVRAYAAAQLDPRGHCEVAEQHAAHYLAVAEEAQPRLFAPRSGPWLARLHTERDNLRAALAWSFAHDPQRGVRLVNCLWHYWDLRGARDEGLYWVHKALTAAGSGPERLPLLSAGSLLHLGRADLADSEQWAGEQLALGRAHEAPSWTGDALALLATVDWARGRYDRAQRRYEDGVSLSLAGGDVWGASLAEAQLARLHRDRREPDAARAMALRALAHAEEPGESTARGLARDVLASIEHRWGDAEEAARLTGEALALYREVNYAEGEASALRSAATIALGAARTADARAAFQAALEVCRRIGHRAGTAEALEGLAEVAAVTGSSDQAAALNAEAARLRDETGIPRLAGD
ncbi:BTAD domain-containing putative transcriptional regulator [Amycolatopsis pithecellobii]|uniref:BTAD domain-containing putative transcriptional regulator n=1 Tax=Amycolatopsis pithecellobii TaxID=664692 RepID=UPI001408D125|nr:BTAD domain-containing putative transcriptional regulator [Amycolatopsis pithecellobii]